MNNEAVNNPAMLPGKHVEYRVKEIKRYIVTRFERYVEGGQEVGSGSEQLGEYPNWDTAYEVGHALCRAEHERLGYVLDDLRISYPVNAKNGTELELDTSELKAEDFSGLRKARVNENGDIEAV